MNLRRTPPEGSPPEDAGLVEAWLGRELPPADERALLERAVADPALAQRMRDQAGIDRALAVLAYGGEGRVRAAVLADLRGGSASRLRQRLVRTLREQTARRRRLRAAVLACAAALLLGLGGLLLARRGPAPDLPVVAALGRPGVVEVVRAGRRHAARDGQALGDGDALVLRGQAEAELRWRDGTALRLAGEAHLAVGGPRPAEVGKLLTLHQGALTAQVAPQPPGHDLAVATPHGEVRVVGTRLAVTVDAAATRLEVTEGLVRLTRSDGATVDVAAGSYAVAAPGVALVAAPLAERLAVESLCNGGFEHGAEGWSLLGDPSAGEVVAAGRHDGALGAIVHGRAQFRQRVLTVPGRAYELRARVRIDAVRSPGTWGGVIVEVWDDTPPSWTTVGGSGHLTAAGIGVGRWHEVAFHFVAPGRTVQVGVGSFTDGDYSLSADDLVLEPAP